MKYYPIEFHTHTIHSDGDFKVDKLIENARKFQYSGLFITDHNTMSGHDEITEDMGIEIFKGVEWTTFNGHMVVLGCEEVGDWTSARIDNIDDCIETIKQNNKSELAIGIAHPFAIGNPICTGCHWEYEVDDWHNIDYIEIYNSANPQNTFWNHMAYEFWLSIISEGHRLSCASGRDWHRMEPENSNVAVSYVGIEGSLSQQNVVAAIKKGRIYTSLAPCFDFEVVRDEIEYNLGDEIEEGIYRVGIKVRKSVISGVRDYDYRIEKIVIFNNSNILVDEEIKIDEFKNYELELEKGFLRFEIIGSIKNRDDTRLLISSPIYVV